MTDAEEAAYFNRQNITPQQQAAFDLYTNPNTEPGSLYNFSQNMNWNYQNGLPMTKQQTDTFNTINNAMHNIGYNSILTRYDHAGTVDLLLQQVGIRGSAANMTPTKLKKLIGHTYTDKRILSTSVNNFKNSFDPTTFTTRQFKFTYKAKASTQAVMPGAGKIPMRWSGMSTGDNFGEMLLGPINRYKIVDVKYSGAKARAKGMPKTALNKKQIEIVVEVE